MPRMVSLEVAEHAVRTHIARTGADLTPYSVVRISGSLPSRDNEFIDMVIVRDEMRMRAGRMVNANQIFRVQQWLAAEAFIAARWPKHQCCAVSYDMIAGLGIERLRPVAPARRRRR